MLFREYLELEQTITEIFIEALLGENRVELASLEPLVLQAIQSQDPKEKSKLISDFYSQASGAIRGLVMNHFKQKGFKPDGRVCNVDDATQLTLIKLLEAIKDGRYQKDNFIGWIATAIAHVVSDLRRSRHSRTTINVGGTGGTDSDDFNMSTMPISGGAMSTGGRKTSGNRLQGIDLPAHDTEEMDVNWGEIKDRIKDELERMRSSNDPIERIQGHLLYYVHGPREHGRKTVSQFTGPEIQKFSKIAKKEFGDEKVVSRKGRKLRLHDYVFIVQGMLVRDKGNIKTTYNIPINADKNPEEYELAKHYRDDTDAKSKLKKLLIERYPKLTPETAKVLWDETRENSFTVDNLINLSQDGLQELKEKLAAA